ncbi:MAG TPA: hypothetical protein VIO16_06015 [Dehalococcoidia bacterium]
MNDKIAQFAEFKRLAAQFRSLLAVSEMLAEIGSLEQAADEAGKRREALLEEERHLRERIAAAELDHTKRGEDVAVESDRKRSAARAEAEAILADARAEAAEMLRSGEAAVKGSRDAASEEAGRVDAAIGARREAFFEIEAAIVDRRDKLKRLDAEVSAARTKHEEIEAHISALRAKF